MDRVATAVRAAGGPGYAFEARATRDVRDREVRQRLLDVNAAWHREPIDVDQLTTLLAAAWAAADAVRDDQYVRLVWTGPPTDNITLATSDTLLRVVNAAENSLILSTYNAQQDDDLVAALEDRIAAGVDVWLIGETKEDAPKDFSGDPATKLASIDGLRFFRWPKQKRHEWVKQVGKDLHAALHAKVAVADANHLLIGSANLSPPAMHSNMEIGVYITGGALPKRVDRHLRTLVELGVICTIA